MFQLDVRFCTFAYLYECWEGSSVHPFLVQPVLNRSDHPKVRVHNLFCECSLWMVLRDVCAVVMCTCVVGRGTWSWVVGAHVRVARSTV